MSKEQEKGVRISRFRIGTGVLIQSVLMIMVVALINYLGYHYYLRVDLSRSQQFRLAMATKQTIRELKQPVKVIVYFSPSSMGPEVLIAKDVTNLLKELQFAAKKNMEIEYVDPMRNLARARELQAQYQFGANENIVILEYGGRTKFLQLAEMGDFDLVPMMGGGEPRVLAFRGEQVFTSALLGLLDPEERRIYFTTGHGEPIFVDEGPLSIFAQYAERLNASVQPLNLGATKVVPQDASVVVIPGPRFDFPPDQIRALEEYWKGDGRVLLLLNPDGDTPNLDGLAARLGVEPLPQRVLRTVPLGFAVGILRDVVGEYLPGNEVTKRLEGVNGYFPDPVQPLRLPEGGSSEEGGVLRALVRAQEDYWGETEFVTDENRGVRYDDGVDTGFPVILAAAVERAGIRDERVEVPAAKMVVVGNALFATNTGLSGPDGSVANLDFLMSSLNWLMDRSKLTGVVPKPPREFVFALSDAQVGRISLFTMILIPGGAALLGVLVWWRRRK